MVARRVEGMMSQAKTGDEVTVHYTGTLADGTVFDSSREREPFTFTLGSGKVIAGFETAVLGLKPGETRRTTIPADQAYGAYQDELIFTVDRDQWPAGQQPAVGEQTQMRRPDGKTTRVTVRDVTPAEVVVDGNHPLAGQNLTFEIELVAIA
jgi:peptidylprolyl isomerase